VQTKLIAALATAGILIGGGALRPSYAQTPPKPETAGIVVVSEARAVVESVDPQARQVLLHLPDRSLVTLNVPPEIGTIDRLKPGHHVAVKYVNAVAINLAKTSTASTAEPAPGRASAGEIQGVRTVVGVDPSRQTVTLADSNNHTRTLGVNDQSMLETLKPGDNVEVTYKEAVLIDLDLVPA
jgi:Cu/Ag efflux protein CusF